MVTVSCIDDRWFQARKGSPALPATRVPLPIPEWEVRDAMARLFVAAKSLDSAPRLAKLLRLDRYKAALAFHHDATEHFGQVATRTKAHQTAANRLASVLQTDTKGKDHHQGETSMNSPLWTQDEAVAFECAQEVITDLISINMAAIYKEEGQPAPDTQRLAELRAEVAALWGDRAHLAITEQEKIARIRSEYGGKVRAYREAQAHQTAA